MSERLQRIPFKTVGFLVLVVGAACFFSWRAVAPDEVHRELPAVCAQCGFAGKAQVGSTPTSEQWPRPCPKCGRNAFYLAVPCPFCRKPIPMKDPAADKIGRPAVCPSCGKPFSET